MEQEQRQSRRSGPPRRGRKAKQSSNDENDQLTGEIPAAAQFERDDDVEDDSTSNINVRNNTEHRGYGRAHRREPGYRFSQGQSRDARASRFNDLVEEGQKPRVYRSTYYINTNRKTKSSDLKATNPADSFQASTSSAGSTTNSAAATSSSFNASLSNPSTSAGPSSSHYPTNSETQKSEIPSNRPRKSKQKNRKKLTKNDDSIPEVFLDDLPPQELNQPLTSVKKLRKKKKPKRSEQMLVQAQDATAELEQQLQQLQIGDKEEEEQEKSSQPGRKAKKLRERKKKRQGNSSEQSQQNRQESAQIPHEEQAQQIPGTSESKNLQQSQAEKKATKVNKKKKARKEKFSQPQFIDELLWILYESNPSSRNPKVNFDHQMVTFRKVDLVDLHAKIETMQSVREQIDYFIEKIALSQDALDNHNRFIGCLQDVISRSFSSDINLKLHTFGSLANGLGTYNSDMDIVIEITAPNWSTKTAKLDFQTNVEVLIQFRKFLLDNFVLVGNLLHGLLLIRSKRCPIIKIDFEKCCQNMKELVSGNGSELSFNKCDISISSLYGVYNSKLLKFFAQYDRRFYEMTMLLKFWAKQNGLISTRTFSSYAFTLIIVFFLQTRSPPVLPTIEQLKNLSQSQPIKIHEFDFAFCDDIDSVGRSANCDPIEELIPQFFEFYKNFDYNRNAICPRLGSTIGKLKLSQQKIAEKIDDFRLSAIVVEDPFVTSHNCGAIYQGPHMWRWRRALREMCARIDANNCVRVLTDARMKHVEFVPHEFIACIRELRFSTMNENNSNKTKKVAKQKNHVSKSETSSSSSTEHPNHDEPLAATIPPLEAMTVKRIDPLELLECVQEQPQQQLQQEQQNRPIDRLLSRLRLDTQSHRAQLSLIDRLTDSFIATFPSLAQYQPKIVPIGSLASPTLASYDSDINLSLQFIALSDDEIRELFNRFENQFDCIEMVKWFLETRYSISFDAMNRTNSNRNRNINLVQPPRAKVSNASANANENASQRNKSSSNQSNAAPRSHGKGPNVSANVNEDALQPSKSSNNKRSSVQHGKGSNVSANLNADSSNSNKSSAAQHPNGKDSNVSSASVNENSSNFKKSSNNKSSGVSRPRGKGSNPSASANEDASHRNKSSNSSSSSNNNNNSINNNNKNNKENENIHQRKSGNKRPYYRKRNRDKYPHPNIFSRMHNSPGVFLRQRTVLLRFDLATCFGSMVDDFGDSTTRRLNVCDISIGCPFEIHRAKLLSFFAEFDERFAELTLILKYWAKRNGFIESNLYDQPHHQLQQQPLLTSYAFTLMIVFFLQNTVPAILPSVEKLQTLLQSAPSHESSSSTASASSINCPRFNFCTDHNFVKSNFYDGARNDTPTEQLLVDFFRFYSSFSFMERPIMPRLGSTELTKTQLYDEKLELEMPSNLRESVLMIEDPINVKDNAGPEDRFQSKAKSSRGHTSNPQVVTPLVSIFQQTLVEYLDCRHMSRENCLSLLFDPEN